MSRKHRRRLPPRTLLNIQMRMQISRWIGPRPCWSFPWEAHEGLPEAGSRKEASLFFDVALRMADSPSPCRAVTGRPMFIVSHAPLAGVARAAATCALASACCTRHPLRARQPVRGQSLLEVGEPELRPLLLQPWSGLLVRPEQLWQERAPPPGVVLGRLRVVSRGRWFGGVSCQERCRRPQTVL